ncbi:Glucose/arabinose dehydrogenase, beta-propeller fold [Actinopolyspora lacussalsi subsp. righensis]|uniref:Glucose/arabinose dehydrogenase, beta-propeller fold n=1 Tax=Actinopolyspora righensis TaxID=995060 RepID=A0A1I7C6P1_9ACTN|nr:Glucose/arabinose dehydrogenase, beta-propeller fold [Actinopolyspora righensis]
MCELFGKIDGGSAGSARGTHSGLTGDAIWSATVAVRTGDRHQRFRAPRRYAAVGTALVAAVLAGGCAEFPDQHPKQWQEQPSLRPQAGPQPRAEEGQQPPGAEDTETSPSEQAEPDGCDDPDPAVVATCLGAVGDVAVLPGGRGALVGERKTGRVMLVERGSDPRQLASVDVDATGGGGLTGLTLSPSYAEDGLAYAYVTTPTDNRVIRIAPDDPPDPVLTGIPRGPSGNAGAITTSGSDALLVATGNAGSPGRTDERSALTGKVLRIDAFGEPAQDNPDPGSPVIAEGLSSPGGVCTQPNSSTFWVTDRRAERDVLLRGSPDEELSGPKWSWRTSPGVAGCAAGGGLIVVALTDASAVYTMRPGPEGTFTGEPERALEDTYGRLRAASSGPNGLLWLGTANKAGGDPVSSDDRVIRIEPPNGGTAGKE